MTGHEEGGPRLEAERRPQRPSDAGVIERRARELLAWPRPELVNAAGLEPEHVSPVSQALAYQSRTYHRLLRMSYLYLVDKVVALAGGRATLRDLDAPLEAAAAIEAADRAAAVVTVAARSVIFEGASDVVAAFDAEALRLTADELRFMSDDAASGAARLTMLTANDADFGEREMRLLRDIYMGLDRTRRACVLVGAEQKMRNDDRREYGLLDHSELALIFGARDPKSLSKRINEDRKALERRVRRRFPHLVQRTGG